MKYFIISQPKSGTYLAANLFQEFGIDPTWMHIGEKKYEQYDPAQLELGRTSPKHFKHRVPVAQSLQLIQHNQFAVGHLKPHPSTVQLLQDFKCVFLTRNLDDIVASGERWLKHSGRGDKKTHDANKFAVRAQSLEPWREQDVFVLDFVHMKQKRTDILDQLQVYLFGGVITDSASAIQRALDTDSLTKVPRED